MLTVKIIDRNNDSDRIFEAQSVTRNGGAITIYSSDDDAEVIGVDENGVELPEGHEITTTVYVMNRNGATVATYHI